MQNRKRKILTFLNFYQEANKIKTQHLFPQLTNKKDKYYIAFSNFNKASLTTTPYSKPEILPVFEIALWQGIINKI